MTEIREAERDGIAWCEAGSGPVVTFLHGLGGSRTAWMHQLRDLAGTHRCVAWDLPGYGESAPLAEMTFGGLSDSWLRWIDGLQLERVDVVGLSFGGMIAQHIAIAHPARVRSLVLADTSPAFGLDGTTADEWLGSRLAPMADGGRPADIADDVIGAIAGPGLTPATHDELIASFSRISTDAFTAACHCLVTHDTRERLDEIVAPTLVLVGEHDHETPLAYAEALASAIPDARLEVVAGAAHLTPSEKPDDFNELVQSFLADPARQGALE